MSHLNYGMIGCGMMGREHIRNIQLLDNCIVRAIVEPDEGMRAEAQRLLPEVEFVDSIAGLLAIESLDCLVITSPNFQHASQLEQIMQIRPMPVLVEKPLYTDAADERILDQLQADYGQPIWVAMEYRYMPPMAKFINACPEITGGVQMLSIREHRFPFLEKVNDWNRFNRYSGGTFVEKCCHFFDLMRVIMGAEPINVYATAGQAHNHLDEAYDGETPDILDHGYVLVNFENGARASLELCMFAEGSYFQEEVSAVGAAGKVEVKIPGPTRFWPEHLGKQPHSQVLYSPRDPDGRRSEEVTVDPEILKAGDHHGSTFYQHEKFRKVLLGKQQPEVTLADGRQAVRMGMAAQESARSGNVIAL